MPNLAQWHRLTQGTRQRPPPVHRRGKWVLDEEHALIQVVHRELPPPQYPDRLFADLKAD